jgi:tetratricopeptide (TPR) repeat protein
MSSELGQPELAIAYIQSAVEINPITDYYKDLGNLCFDLNRYQEALYCFEKVIEDNPDDGDTYYNLGMIYQKLNKIDRAIESFKAILRLNPEDAEIYNILGSIYCNANQDTKSAIVCFEKAIELKPDSAEVYFNLGLAYNLAKELDKAIPKYEKAMELQPDNAGIYNNLGTIYQEKNDLEKAIFYYKKGLEIYPEHPSLRFNLGCSLIKTGDFAQAWDYFESRMNLFKHHRLKFPVETKPKWDGSMSLENKTVYVYPASRSFGYGDSINFVRYLPLLNSLGAKVICRVQPGLEQLFNQSELNVEIIPNSTEDTSLEFDFQLPFMSLPAVFRSNPDNIPAKNLYIKADPQKSNDYKAKYFNNDGFKVGIFWYSAVSSSDRTMSLEQFYPILEMKNIKFYSLQKGEGIEQLNNIPEGLEIVNLGETFNDFSDTAAAVSNLDLIITPDTSIAHLGGALGKPTWVMLPFMSDWRWLVDREDSIWYKSVKLFRQKEPANWNEVIERIRVALNEKVNT